MKDKPNCGMNYMSSMNGTGIARTAPSTQISTSPLAAQAAQHKAV